MLADEFLERVVPQLDGRSSFEEDFVLGGELVEEVGEFGGEVGCWGMLVWDVRYGMSFVCGDLPSLIQLASTEAQSSCCESAMVGVETSP